MFIKRLKKVIKNPLYLFSYLNHIGFLKFIPDDIFIKFQFKRVFRKPLDLTNPTTFNEKIQWLKLFDRNPLYTILSDKYNVRNFISGKVGQKYLVPLLGTWNDPNDIPFELLPKKFVLKTTHDSGGVILCKDKDKLDIKKTKKNLRILLNNNYYYHGREWPYKNISPKIICEEFLEDSSKNSLVDYKFLCFNGIPKIMYIATDRGNGTKFNFFDMEFSPFDVKQYYPNNPNKFNIPQNFEKMKNIAMELSKNLPHLRVDFYEVSGKLYIGELTLYHFNGLKKFEPMEFDLLLGSWLTLPNKKFS